MRHAPGLLAALVLFAISGGCAAIGLEEGTATAELRISRIGAGVVNPSAAVDMRKVLESARRILNTIRFRDGVEEMLRGKVTLPHDWTSRIVPSIKAEQMELLVTAQVGRGGDSALVANAVGRKLAEFLRKVGFTAVVIHHAPR